MQKTWCKQQPSWKCLLFNFLTEKLLIRFTANNQWECCHECKGRYENHLLQKNISEQGEGKIEFITIINFRPDLKFAHNLLKDWPWKLRSFSLPWQPPSTLVPMPPKSSSSSYDTLKQQPSGRVIAPEQHHILSWSKIWNGQVIPNNHKFGTTVWRMPTIYGITSIFITSLMCRGWMA